MASKLYPVLDDDSYVYPQMSLYKMQCCDCGLVHNIVTDIIRVRDPKQLITEDEIVNDPELKVRWKVTRNQRATGQVRRYRKIKIKEVQ